MGFQKIDNNNFELDSIMKRIDFFLNYNIVRKHGTHVIICCCCNVTRPLGVAEKKIKSTDATRFSQK